MNSPGYPSVYEYYECALIDGRAQAKTVNRGWYDIPGAAPAPALAAWSRPLNMAAGKKGYLQPIVDQRLAGRIRER